MKKVKGYKAFNKDLTCRDMQYEIGKTYKLDGELRICENGFHFCKSLADCYRFYNMSDDIRICRVEAIGNVVTDDEVKFCTDEITIISEVRKPQIKSNLSDDCSGYCNSGNCNSGNWNSGNWNSGNCNSGNCNSGNCNSGNCNSGDWNSGNCNSGVFNTDTMPKIKMFDKESEWTIQDWKNSKAYYVLCGCPYTHSDFIYEGQMSDEEKENHPEYKTIGGYLKTIVVTKEDKKKWWDGLFDDDKQSVYDLPNFDKNKFKECTEIEVGE